MALGVGLCLPNATAGYSDMTLTFLEDKVYDKVFYKYSHCPNTSSAQLFLCPKRKLMACFCSWEMAQPFFDSFLCNVREVKALASAEISVALLGIIFNVIVLSTFFQRKKIQNKVGNILLASQALVDLMNAVLYGIPHGLMCVILPDIYFRMSKTDEMSFTVAIHSMHLFSFNCSLYLFTLIAVERYLALCKPIWHRQNVTRGWILKRVVVVMIISVVVTPISCLSVLSSIIPLFYVMIILGLLWIGVVSVLFVFSFVGARKSLQKKKTQGIRTDEVQDLVERKIFRLTLIFLIMYGLFLMSLVPLLVVTVFWTIGGHFSAVPNMVSCLLFTATSVANPLLTLGMREDYSIVQRRGAKDVSRGEIFMNNITNNKKASQTRR